MRTTCKLAAIAAAAACVALWPPTLASAAVTIGGDITAPGDPNDRQGCGPAPCELAQLSLASGQTTAPFDGVVVRWRVNDATGSFALRVLRAVAFNYTFISTSAVRTPASIAVESFPTRQPIEAGDYVGLEAGPQSGIGLANPGTAGDTAAGWEPTPDGHIAAPVAVAGGITFAYDADVEPDADHDGYGDETQDKCPTDASTQDVCPPAPPAAAPPAAGTQSAASTPAADRTPPAISVPARAVRLSKGGSITFLVACSEDATGVATATVRVARLVRFAARTITLTARVRTKVTLRLSHTNAALVRRALAKRAKPNAIVALSVKDAAGNPSATKRPLKLRR